MPDTASLIEPQRRYPNMLMLRRMRVQGLYVLMTKNLL